MSKSRPTDTGLTIGVPMEAGPRVALVPADVASLIEAGFRVLVESGAGLSAGYIDDAYADAGAVVTRRPDVRGADVVTYVDVSKAEGPAAVPNSIVVGVVDARRDHRVLRSLMASGVTAYALELMPRTTRAQSMDVMSSQAALTGYQAVLIAAEHLDRVLPMMSTAAGTLPPARVMVIGAGVAGLQAIATARRLGARVSAYDVRPEARDQVISVGGDFIDLQVSLDAGSKASDENGYARPQSIEDQVRTRALLAGHIALADVVICTALVQGRTAPVIVDADMVRAMRPGSVIVDLAASHGGNCEVVEPGRDVVVSGVHVLGRLDVIDRLAADASRLFSRNVRNFIQHLAPGAELRTPPDPDPIHSATCVTRAGAIARSGLAVPCEANTAVMATSGVGS